MDAFLRNAEQILETACGGRESGASEYLIAICRTGAMRMLYESAGWLLPALAAEYGATAVYRVSRGATKVRVEGWSAGRKCLLDRDLDEVWWSRPNQSPVYATATLLAAGGASVNDRSPQVWNS
jgi:hypothetical protein